MKVPFALPTDGKTHRFCFKCMAEGVGREMRNGERVYPCPACGYVAERTLFFDERKAWLDDTRELWHESVALLLRNHEGRYLFFLRNEFPRHLSLPAGHLDIGMLPSAMAKEELEQETGLKRLRLRHVLTTDIIGDSCSSGADAHKWHLFATRYKSSETITLGDEATGKLAWLTLDEALETDIVPPVRFLIKNFRKALEN
ncbi:MAG TPA: NUDIX hydrolase [Patescibacteria group bacterium]|nr:NUDIX hydrolase [Patescibacteria group bacterium]